MKEVETEAMNRYRDTFITVAADCPVSRGVVPPPRGGRKTIPLLQHELLSGHPYRFTQDDLFFEVHVRHKAIPAEELEARGPEIRSELLARPHACLRASVLAKSLGWGIHYDARGRIAIYPRESEEYRRFTREGTATLVPAMRNSRERA